MDDPNNGRGELFPNYGDDDRVVTQRVATQDATYQTAIDFNIVGASESIQFVRQAIAAQANYDAPVLVSGETGTGKELAARGLHYGGTRADQPFIPVNCATLTDDLFMSEVFGYKKGAFTDAKQDKKGLLASADRGTLFLDEVDSLSLKCQAALLRLLQEGEYRPVGSDKPLKANVRLIASANCDLEARIANGQFRQDLYYRLYILSVHMPPLRERNGDVELLIQYFLNNFSHQYGMGEKRLSHDLLQQLVHHSWPGNVRELENMLHRLYLTCPGDLIGASQLSLVASSVVLKPQKPVSEPKNSFPLHQPQYTVEESETSEYDFSRDKKIAVEHFEKQYVENLLSKCGGNVTRAASMCGKERRAFGKLVKKYNLKKMQSYDTEFAT
jgi:DNA-binding NtrC family response regulator